MALRQAGHFANDRFLKNSKTMRSRGHSSKLQKRQILDKYRLAFILERVHRPTSIPGQAGQKHPRNVLKPLHKARSPWFATTLGEWSVGDHSYALEQYLFAGPRGGGDYFRVGIFAGIHGDEIAGVLAAVRFLQQLAEKSELARGYELYFYPLCNPSGFEDGTRHARSGRDLNREFWLGSHEPEVQLLERQIRTLRFDGLISLHADDDSPGLYAFALGAQVTQHVVEPALAAAEKILPRNRDAKIDNFVASNGLIRKGYPGILCGAPEAHPRPFEIVFETPHRAELEAQIEANLVFLRHALEQFQQLQAVGQDL
jgi:protein MpaA